MLVLSGAPDWGDGGSVYVQSLLYFSKGHGCADANSMSGDLFSVSGDVMEMFGRGIPDGIYDSDGDGGGLLQLK